MHDDARRYVREHLHDRLEHASIEPRSFWSGLLALEPATLVVGLYASSTSCRKLTLNRLRPINHDALGCVLCSSSSQRLRLSGRMPDQSVGTPAGAGLLQRPSADNLVSTTIHSYRPDDGCIPGLLRPDSRWSGGDSELRSGLPARHPDHKHATCSGSGQPAGHRGRLGRRGEPRRAMGLSHGAQRASFYRLPRSWRRRASNDCPIS